MTKKAKRLVGKIFIHDEYHGSRGFLYEWAIDLKNCTIQSAKYNYKSEPSARRAARRVAKNLNIELEE